jgi:hypothetical protein
MASQYNSEYPAVVDFDDAFKEFISEFYRISDTPDAHETYAQQYTDDATLVMASKKVVGVEGTVSLSRHSVLSQS